VAQKQGGGFLGEEGYETLHLVKKRGGQGAEEVFGKTVQSALVGGGKVYRHA